MNELQVLMRARDLVERNWTKRTLARDVWGDEVSPYEVTARSFCAIGAVRRAQYEIGGRVPDKPMFRSPGGRVLVQVCPLPGFGSGFNILTKVSTFNDTHSKEEVLALFDEAISRLLKEVYALEGRTPDQPDVDSSEPVVAGVS